MLGSPVSISAAGQDGHYPQAAIDAAGNARLVWVRFDGTDDRIQTRSLSPAGVRGTVTTLSDPGGSETFPQLSTDAPATRSSPGNASMALRTAPSSVPCPQRVSSARG